ncbi:MAG TPA: hypothetical protein VFO32_05210 [Sphingomicrobium sp.]|nr:hypothetical protein [Sphingomicrobium sp.]
MVRQLLLAVSAALFASTSSAAVLVVRSSGPSAAAYPAGKALPDSHVLKLKASDTIVLLDSRGTRTLSGPGNFSVSASAAPAAVGRTTGATARRVRLGAVRGAGARSVWQADLGRSGNICVANPADFGLYRASSAGAERVTITDSAGKTATVQFPDGQRIVSWPADMPITAGASYSVKGSGAPANVTVRWITPVPGGLEGLAQVFIRNDCQAQLDVLIDTFASPSAS